MGMVDLKSDNRSLPRRLLIVSFEQFGYHTDSYEYCRHLGDSFRITYLCPDQGLPRKSLAGVDEDPGQTEMDKIKTLLNAVDRRRE